MSPILHFPPHAVIVNYLEKHPCTSHPSFRDQGIIKAAAQAFANQDRVLLGIEMGVQLILCEYSEQTLPIAAKVSGAINLMYALQDCAEEKALLVNGPISVQGRRGVMVGAVDSSVPLDVMRALVPRTIRDRAAILAYCQTDRAARLAYRQTDCSEAVERLHAIALNVYRS